jgi:hypothetical protein
MSIAGSWEVAIHTPMGDQLLSVDFTDDHTGVARYGQISAPLTDVSVSGDTMTCSIVVTEPLPVTFRCSATVDGDTMTGTARAGVLGSFAMAGRRSAR